MTSDYVNAILRIGTWEEFEDTEGYFLGLFALRSSSATSPFPAARPNERRSSEAACQTPSEWLLSSPPIEVKEAVPEAAPKRKVTLRPGMNRPRPKDLLEHEVWRDLWSIVLTLDVLAPIRS